MLKEKNKFYKIYRNRPSVYNKTNYNTYKTILSSLLVKSEKEYNQTLFEPSKSNIKTSWKILKDLIRIGQNNITHSNLKIDGKLMVLLIKQ